MTGRRHNVFWIVVVLVVAIGSLAIANLIKFDPETVKAELGERMAEYRRIPESEVLRRDAFLEDLIRNESFRDHAKAQYREVERLHGRVHEAAELELEAQKVVPPFLRQCRDLSQLSAEEIRRLHDESRSHLVNYGMTRQGPPLREAQGRLTALLEKQDRIEPKEILELQKDVRKLCDAGKFVEASRLIAEFRKRPGITVYAGQLREIEATVARMSAAAVKPR